MASGELRRGDQHQETAIEVFQNLHNELDEFVKERRKQSKEKSGLSMVSSLRSGR